VRLTGQKDIKELPQGHPGFGGHIKDSPFTVHIQGAGAGNSYATGPGVEGALVGKDAPFTIHSVTPDGKPCQAGGSNFTATVSGPENIGDVRIGDNGDGTYTGVYRVSKPGHYTVEITLEGERIKGSPYKLLILNAHAGKSYAEGPGLEGGQQNKEGVFTIFAVGPDGKRVASGGDPFEVAVKGPGGDSVRPAQVDNGDGTYTVTYTPRKYGDYEISVQLHGENIRDAPFRVSIKAAPNAGKTYAEGSGLDGAWLNEEAVFTIHAIDEDGNPRRDGGDIFNVKVKGPGGDDGGVQVADNGDGTYTVTYTPTQVGDYNIDVVFEGQHIKGAPFNVETKKRPADPRNSYAHGPGLEPGNETNQPLHFTIVAKNVHDEQVDYGGNKFDVVIAGPTGDKRPDSIKDNEDGTYSVTYSVSKPGDYQVGIQLDGEKIKGVPYNVHIGGPDASNSYATGPGVEGAVAKQAAPFRIHAVGADGQPNRTGGDPFKVRITGPDGSPGPEIQLRDNEDGTYDGEYTVDQPGEYVVDVTLDGVPIKDAPFHVLVENARASLSYAEGPGLEGGQQYKEGVFTIFAVGTDGQRRTDGGDPFRVEIGGVDNVKASLNDNEDGTYSVAYVPRKHGEYVITVTLHGENIKASPFNVRIKPAPNAGKSFAEGPGLLDAWDNEPAYFTIHAIDEDGNPRADGGDVFDVRISGPEEVQPKIVDNGDGTYSVTYNPQEPGDYEISVQLEGQNIKDAPFRVKVREGTDADNSGFGIFSFTIQARDKRGREKTFGGDHFEVHIKGPDAEIEVSTLDNGDGTYTAIYALAGDNVKGKTFRVHATLNGKTVGEFNQNM